MKGCNRNEQCLLKYISGSEQNSSSSGEIVEAICKLGIKLKFTNNNPIYQIIDELTFCTSTGK